MEQPKNYLVFFSTRQKLKLFTFVKSIEIRKMVSFELGKEIEKDVFSSCHERGTKEKILSPHEESNLRPLDSALRCSTTEPQRPHGERGLLRSSYDTRLAYCLDQQCRWRNVCR